MSVTLTSDLSQQVNWVVREKTDSSLTLNVTLSSAAYDISSYVFIAEFYKVGSTTPFLSLTQGAGITNNGATGVLTIALTDTQLTITPDQYFWKLKTTSPTDNLWFNGSFTVNGYLWDGSNTSTTSVALTIGTTSVTVALTLAGTGSATSMTINDWSGTTTLPNNVAAGYWIKFLSDCTVSYLGGSVFYGAGTLAISFSANSGSASNWYALARG